VDPRFKTTGVAFFNNLHSTKNFKLNRIENLARVLGLPDPDPLVRGTDPDPSKISKKNLDLYC
jgi:hypothetical protein